MNAGSRPPLWPRLLAFLRCNIGPLVVPLLPLIFELMIKQSVSDSTLTITAALYPVSLSALAGSEVSIEAIVLCAVFAGVHGSTLNATGGLHDAVIILAWIAIGGATVTHIVACYFHNIHGQEQTLG